jgi:hypothetical protein
MNKKVHGYYSIIQKLHHRTLTGQGLGLSIHRHCGLALHLSWNKGNKTGSYQNCIARKCHELPLLFEILLLLRKSSLTGLCKCIFGTHIGYGERTIGICFYTEEGFFCRCQVNFVLEISEECTYLSKKDDLLELQ